MELGSRSCFLGTILRHPVERADPSSAGGRLSTLPVRRVGHGTRSFAGSHRAVWVGRGATTRQREAEWSSRVAHVFWGCYNQNISKYPRIGYG